MRTDDSNNIYKLTSVSPVNWELVPSKSYVDNAISTGVKSVVNFKGATSTAAGTAGLVPAPAKGTQTDYYLSADGTWKKVQQRTIKEVINIVHPVGSIWETTTTDDPNVLWAGTTWVKMDAGRVLVAAGSYTESGTTYTYNLGDTGGEAKHQLSTDELATHGHDASISTTSLIGDTYTSFPAEYDNVQANGVLSCSKYGDHCAGDGGKQGNGHIHIDVSHGHNASISATGGNARHENRPPYTVINRWKRTA